MAGIVATDLDTWIATLRSGTYEQGKGALQVVKDADFDEHGEKTYASWTNSFCCLGVWDKCHNVSYRDLGLGKEDMESSETKVETGLTELCRDTLAHFNDTKMNFQGIATMLDQNRESLISHGSFTGEFYALHACHLGMISTTRALREANAGALPQ